MSDLNYQSAIKENVERLKFREQALGRNLRQPYSSTNSGVRKLMHSIHQTHAFSLIHPEKALNETGYEIKYGDYSSSILSFDHPIVVLYKIPKYSFNPNHHYYLIVQDTSSGILDVIERVSYKHVTESYCYLYNNSYLDSLNVNDIIPANRAVRCSTSYDDYGNRKDGRNLRTGYISTLKNTEDSLIISDEAAPLFDAPLLHFAKCIMNENDIPVNYYGDENIIKIMPDIGERTKNNIVCAFRKERKEEAFYSQDYHRMMHLMMSDERRLAKGTVVDINIRCNNPDLLESDPYYSQINAYWKEQKRFASTLVAILSQMQGVKKTYKLNKLYGQAKDILHGKQYLEGKVFSNIKLEICVLEENHLNVGDKLANRYGGKGVVSEIRPKRLMPKIEGTDEYLDIICNQATMTNRENPGQNFESSVNHISEGIVNYIKLGILDPKECIDMIREFYTINSQKLGEEFDRYTRYLTEEEMQFYIEAVCEKGCIDISTKPISEPMTIDKIALMYEKFPFVKQNWMTTPLRSSTGKIRYIRSRRPIVTGKVFMYRLKQFAEEKFSATSLSAVNITNENTKSKAARDFKEPFPSTPIKQGNMEEDDLSHMGIEYVVSNLMIHSVSPHGRRLVEQLYTGDPFHVDIRLDKESKNRSAEKFTTYLKTAGLRLKFTKVKKIRRPGIIYDGMIFTEDPSNSITMKDALIFSDPDAFADEIEKKNMELLRSGMHNGIEYNALEFVNELAEELEEPINPIK